MPPDAPAGTPSHAAAEDAACVFGPHAPALKAKIFKRIAIAVVAIDLITKVAAKLLLNPDPARYLGFIRFSLQYNDSFVGAHAQGLIRPVDALAAGVTGALAVLLALRWIDPRWPGWLKLGALALGVVLPAAVAVAASLRAAPDLLIAPALGFFAHGLFVLGLWWVAMRLTRSRLLFVAAALEIAGALGNVLSLVYSPQGVVDFIWIPAIAPLLGVFNLADVAIVAGTFLILAWLPVRVAARILGRTPLRGRVWGPLPSLPP